MRKLILATAFLLASCSTKHLKVADRLMTEDFNEYSFKKPCAIYFKDSTKAQDGKEFRIEKDVAYWTNVKTGQEDSAAVLDIKKVSFTNHGRGAGLGAGIGAGAGTALAVVALMSASEEDKRAKQAGDEYWVSSTVVALIVSPILILGGTGTGALIGLIKGYETIYRFE